MKFTLNRYLAVLAALLSIASSLFFIYALDKRHVYEVDAAAPAAQTMGVWLFMASLVLWLAYAVFALTAPGRTRKK